MNVREAIQTGDADALTALLAEEPRRANELIVWGENDHIRTHPLHFVSDMVFGSVLARGKEIALVDALIYAGADLDFQQEDQGDTPLIGAASLEAEEVGLRLLEAGARPEIRGLFAETALHWAALLGLERLTMALAPVTDLTARDRGQNSTPLGWALHGWSKAQPAARLKHEKAALTLLAAGAPVEAAWLENDRFGESPAIQAALHDHIGR